MSVMLGLSSTFKCAGRSQRGFLEIGDLQLQFFEVEYRATLQELNISARKPFQANWGHALICHHSSRDNLI